MFPTAIIHELNCRAAIQPSLFGRTTYQAYIPRHWWTEVMLLQYDADAAAITMFVEEQDFTRDGGPVTLEELALRLPLFHPKLDEFSGGNKMDYNKRQDTDDEVYPKDNND